MMRQCLATVLLGCAATAGVAAANETTQTVPPPRLKAGDIVVFCGDSITEKGNLAGGWIELMESAILKHRRGEEIRLLGRGVGGMKLRGLRDQFDRDIGWPRPTVVVIEIGMNDILDPAYEDTEAKRMLFELGYNDLIWRARRHGAVPVLLTHTLYGEQAPGTNAFDERLDRYSALIREIGRKKQCAVIEMRQPFLDYIAANNPDNLRQGILTYDGAHLNDRGNRLMADLLIAAFGLEPPARGAEPAAPPSHEGAATP